MKFSYSWLKELVDIKLSPEKLAELLSEHAFEVEATKESQHFENIIVAKVTKVEKHPNADRLRVIELTDGTNTFAPVVCGAWNFDVGAIVPLALPGATIPHDQHDPEGKSFVLGKAKIRGIESQGMICSAKELGLSGDGDGILLLDQSASIGEIFSVEPKNASQILDISIPANRPDLMGYLGIAREVSAIAGAKLKFKLTKTQIFKLKAKVLQVQVAVPKLCPKYSAVRLVGVRVGESPKFIQERLQSAGLKSINNVVDITNLVMLELGQPLHAFDAAKINGPIKVRQAFVNESIVTLDGIPRKLESEAMVIADSKKVIAIAGVMGGLETAVSANTTEVILEAANFNSVSVRKTYKKLGLRTDAASRFEKGVPISFVDQGLEYATALLVAHSGAKAVEYVASKTAPLTQVNLELNPSDVNRLLGFEVKASEQKRVLSKFGFKVMESKGSLLVTIPDWRTDVRIWQDLVEEIGRFIGLNKIPQVPALLIPSSVPSDPLLVAADEIRDLLVSLGFYESFTYSFVPESFFVKNSIPTDTAVEITNPISADLKYMRTGIGMNYELLVEQNARFVSEQSMFEIGNVYRQEKGNIKEQSNLFLIRFSKNSAPEIEFLGSLRELFARLGISFSVKQSSEQDGLVLAGTEEVGVIRAQRGDLSWIAAELSLEKLVKHFKQTVYSTIARFPAKQIDIAVLVNESVAWENVKEVIQKLKIGLLSSIELIEVYQGKNIGPGKKSFTIRLTYQSTERTLTDEEVVVFETQIIQKLKAELNAESRG